MENLNLKKLWEVCNTLSWEEAKLEEEKDTYISLLGNQSEYSYMQDFDYFLNHYSFRVEGENIIVFNTDPIPYEDYCNNDISYVPIPVLGFGEKEIEKWMEEEIAKQLEQQEKDRIAQKEDIKRQIELLNKRLNNL
jgi:hypothetical protein